MLYLIPTPIFENGLEDIPEKTRQIAAGLDCFICERGKTARHFLKQNGTTIPLQQMTFCDMDMVSPKEVGDFFLQQAKMGKRIGLLSEAGCPAVADPGADIVALAHRNMIPVIPLPGPSSLIMALMASGMSGQSFCFHGYLSAKRDQLGQELRRLEQTALRLKQTQFFIEAPYRNNQVVEVALAQLANSTSFGIVSEVSSPQAYIRTTSIGEWKNTPPPDLHKKNTVFLLFST